MKYTPGYWRITPLFRVMLEILASKPEGIYESSLEELLRKEYGLTLSKPELYHTLMKLELSGLIQVESVGRELFIKLSPRFYEYVR
ncbi:MAG: ArsR family transcriptional regulator [Desulfurococcus sp.]|nr:ArsR family transcriptional regulator [Desulfurococcus sp.]